MKLRYVTNSPYCRKVAIAARLLGLENKIELLNNETDIGDEIRSQNPLNKIPILITDEGQPVYDSSVIVRYLDCLAGGGKLYPVDARQQAHVMTTEALADGIMDALGLISQEERWRPAEQMSAKWIAHQRTKIDKGLAALETSPPSSMKDAGAIAVASMLGFLDLRDKQPWRDKHPKLVAWLDAFAASTPAFAETAPGTL
jgi:glutathione S-transferase